MTVCLENKHFIIYKITNQVNEKVYIGQTVKTLERRKERHIRDAMLGSGCAVHRAIRKYGIENFRFETLFYCLSKEEMDQKEIETIKVMRTKSPAGYNLTDGGEGGCGQVVSAETREKRRISQTGRKASDETREKMRVRMTGLNLSDETKLKMSKVHIGNKYNLGRKATLETRIKLSLAKKGKPRKAVQVPKSAKWYAVMNARKGKPSSRVGYKHSDETRAKMRTASLGRKHTDEARAKIKAAWVIRKQKMAYRIAA
jgi:hypothetical protein